VHGAHSLPFAMDLLILAAFCIGLFALSLRNIRKHWIA
jgi:ABC-2 type transport system permease protein